MLILTDNNNKYMSTTSAKARYTQFSDWLTTFKKSTASTGKTVVKQRVSKMDHYKNKGVR
tara:strand:- start:3 stop:182 length:180 start_codon:yes stop_codon:yes gene_type:complete